MKPLNELTAHERKVYEAVKAQVVIRRDRLVSLHGNDWRKHEVPFTDEQMKAIADSVSSGSADNE